MEHFTFRIAFCFFTRLVDVILVKRFCSFSVDFDLSEAINSFVPGEDDKT
jgi:hypothetical protein